MADIPTYVTVDSIEHEVRNNINCIPELNKMIHNQLMIADNPLSKPKMTLREYNNWMSGNPKFTLREWNNKWGSLYSVFPSSKKE